MQALQEKGYRVSESTLLGGRWTAIDRLEQKTVLRSPDELIAFAKSKQ